MGIKLGQSYSTRQRLRHHNAASRHTHPTIYKPESQIRGSRPLPPPKQLTERKGTDGLAGGETRET